jgi:hypothetical protein
MPKENKRHEEKGKENLMTQQPLIWHSDTSGQARKEK